jgi:hypothetical protein
MLARLAGAWRSAVKGLKGSRARELFKDKGCAAREQVIE